MRPTLLAAFLMNSLLPTTFTVALLMAFLSSTADAQTANATQLNFNDASNLCSRKQESENVCVTLAADSTTDQIDIFFLLDGTVAFFDEIEQLQRIIETTIVQLSEEVVADIAYGVGRFQDYGGLATGFAGGSTPAASARPFVLNQPILSEAAAGNQRNLRLRIVEALGRGSLTSPPGGATSPQSALEGLYQVAVGTGLDMNGDGSLLGLLGDQNAGTTIAQLNPDASGDVPPFSSLLNTVQSSGSLGGAGFRPDALKIVILATDSCSIAAFNNAMPNEISSVYNTVPTMDFACDPNGSTPRFGLVSDSLRLEDNTVNGAVVPQGAHTLVETVDAILQEGIRVVGMSPNAFPQANGAGPSNSESVFFSALARLTGSLSGGGIPYTISMNSNDAIFQRNLISVVRGLVTIPATVEAISDCVVSGRAVETSFSSSVQDVAVGREACFQLGFSLNGNSFGSDVSESCTVSFDDQFLGITYAEIPVTVNCVNGAPVAQCRGVSGCDLSISVDDINNGSSDPDSDPLTLTLSPDGPYDAPGGTTVTLTVSDGTLSSSCQAFVNEECSMHPSYLPSARPSLSPSSIPSVSPSDHPSLRPSSDPSRIPSLLPSKTPTRLPSADPSQAPSSTPSFSPTSMPTSTPSTAPSDTPAGTNINLIFFERSSDFCTNDSQTVGLCVKLPYDSLPTVVDIFFLFDDTSMFSDEIQQISRTISQTMSSLRTALPTIDFGFGVGRFDDYGGDAAEYAGREGRRNARPFILNQPIVNLEDGGGASALDDLITSAINRFPAETGQVYPSVAIAEALFQTATGLGLDLNGDGFTTGNNRQQFAGAATNQDVPDNSGDVAAFSTLASPIVNSGSIGGAGFRDEALKIVILGVESCSIAAFPEPLPTTVTSIHSSEVSDDFSCTGTTGASSYGLEGDSVTFSSNTIGGAVIPSGGATVSDAVDALVGAGIRVIGMTPGATPSVSGAGPSDDEGVYLSALARLTGAVDQAGNPILIDTAVDDNTLVTNIVTAIEQAVDYTTDLTVATECIQTSVSAKPSEVTGVDGGDRVCFDVTLSKQPINLVEYCGVQVVDSNLGITYAEVPVDVNCNEGPTARCRDVYRNRVNCQARVTGEEVDFGSTDPDTDNLDFFLFPGPPYFFGETPVTLTVSDGFLSDTCTAVITIDCGTPPTTVPSGRPSFSPSKLPSTVPTSSPSGAPTSPPTSAPSDSPSARPSATPSSLPTTSTPSRAPSSQPSAKPTRMPSSAPSKPPSARPSSLPTAIPSASPSAKPSSSPSSRPTGAPSKAPSSNPTGLPSIEPTSPPTFEPTFAPTATQWTPQGQVLFGLADRDSFGSSIAISEDGSILAVGATGATGVAGVNSGRVRVYRYDGQSAWGQIGQNIDGEMASDSFGSSVALSADGTVLAVGAIFNNGSTGHVRAFEFNGVNRWDKLGEDLEGEATGDWFGTSVALSSDGLTLASGAVLNDGGGNAAGHVRVYRYSFRVFDWVQLGADLEGSTPGAVAGQSVALSADGNTVVIGAPFHTEGFVRGLARVLTYDEGDNEWDRSGNDILGESTFANAGNSVDISADGNRVAVGAYGYNKPAANAGLVRVYDLQGTTWVQVGQDLPGAVGGERFGFSVSLSHDGTVVAGGTGLANNDVGLVRLYEYDGLQWNQLGATVSGTGAESFGNALALSDDGLVVVGGASDNDENVEDGGAVRVFFRIP